MPRPPQKRTPATLKDYLIFFGLLLTPIFLIYYHGENITVVHNRTVYHPCSIQAKANGTNIPHPEGWCFFESLDSHLTFYFPPEWPFHKQYMRRRSRRMFDDFVKLGDLPTWEHQNSVGTWRVHRENIDNVEKYLVARFTSEDNIPWFASYAVGDMDGYIVSPDRKHAGSFAPHPDSIYFFYKNKVVYEFRVDNFRSIDEEDPERIRKDIETMLSTVRIRKWEGVPLR